MLLTIAALAWQVGAALECPKPVEKAPVTFPQELLNDFSDERMFSGYINVTDRDFLFYWFVEAKDTRSNGNANPPVILWSNGGPGCTSMEGATTEIGPLLLKGVKTGDGYSGRLSSNPFAWNHRAHIIFVDQPRYVGYSTGSGPFVLSSKDAAADIVQFIRGWRRLFPQFASSKFVLATESYGGHYVPAWAEAILEFNRKTPSEEIVVAGVVLSNTCIDQRLQGFDGLTLLNITDDQFREDLVILYPKARQWLHHYIEKLWNFKRPLPCPSGAYCNEGTCPRYLLTGIVDVDFDRASNAINEARRLAEMHYSDLIYQTYVNRSRNDSNYTNVHPGEDMVFANTSGDNWTFNGSFNISRWDMPSDCSDCFPNQSQHTFVKPGEASTMREAYLHVHREFEQAESLGAPAPRMRSDMPMHELYAPGEATSLAPELALRQLVSQRKSGQWREWMTGANVSAGNTSMSRNDSEAWNASVAYTRQLQEDQVLATTEFALPAINPLAMRAPQQCMAGTYCDARAASSAGTGLCPAGKYCPPGSPIPEEAPEGVFVDGSGSVRGVQCFPGQFAPFKNTPRCYPCPAGASCPDFGTTTPFICPPGTFREPSLGNGSQSTISCEPCAAGTWSPWRGTPDFSSCEPCPEGRVCPVGTGNVSQGTICPEGHICSEGTTPEEQTDVRCYDGFFCRSSTTPTSVYRDLCPPGFYCAEATTYVNRYKFRCPEGFYCPEGTGARDDLKRPLMHGDVCVMKKDFYLAQKVAQFCLRQIMRNRFEFVALEQQRLARANLPLIDRKEMTEIWASWMQDFELQYCQEDAIMAVWEKYYMNDIKGNDVRAGILAMIQAIQSVDFLKSQLLNKLQILPENYRNKCSEHSPLLGDQEFAPRACPNPDQPCNNVSQLECLCKAPSTAKMLDCFDGDYPDPLCVNTAEDGSCLDPSTDIQIGGTIDDFDLMAGHYLSYVQQSLKEEMQAQKSAMQNTMTRCPFGTMTTADGSMLLGDCVKRKSVRYVEEQLDMTVLRANPVDTYLSPKKWAKSAGNRDANEGEFRPVYAASAGSVSLITFDIRHFPDEFRYGKHWRIKFFVGSTLDPLYDDPIECDSLVAKRLRFGLWP